MIGIELLCECVHKAVKKRDDKILKEKSQRHQLYYDIVFVTSYHDQSWEFDYNLISRVVQKFYSKKEFLTIKNLRYKPKNLRLV